VLAFDARGHGENRNPLRRGFVRADAFHEDLAAAVDFLRASPFVDGTRIALMGHSMGAGAALDFATRDSGIDAAVLISGGRRLDGPYAPPNALFLVAGRDPPGIRSRAAELVARLAGVEGAEPGRTYGSLAAGTAVRLAVVEGAGHASILWSDGALHEVLAWLDLVFGVERAPGPPPRDARTPALLAVALCFALALPGLGLLVAWLAPPRDPLPPAGRARGLAALAVAFAATLPLLATGTPAEILSAEVADAVVAQLALAGVALLLWLRWREPGLLASALRDPAPALVAAAVGVLAVFVGMQPFGAVVHRMTLTPERMAVFAMAALGLLPFSLAFACLLRRGPAPGACLFALAGRALVIGLLVAGVATGVLGFVVLLLLPALCGVFALVEIVAAFAYAGSRNLLAIALLDAGWLAFAVAAAAMPVKL
jgi:pimeloyl-ACP methyl ester carboxylesterase